MKLYNITFWYGDARLTAYVMAEDEILAEDKVIKAYSGCVVRSCDEWPYDMVVM